MFYYSALTLEQEGKCLCLYFIHDREAPDSSVEQQTYWVLRCTQLKQSESHLAVQVTPVI